MRPEELVAQLLTRHHLTLATAESLTGGQVGHVITSVPGASAFYKGGVISYATEAKERVLDVDADLLRTHGPVSAEAAVQMATNVRKLFEASIGVSTTGVAGPSMQDGHPVGTLHVGVADERGAEHFALRGPAGTRAEVRAWATTTALELLSDRLRRLPD